MNQHKKNMPNLDERYMPESNNDSDYDSPYLHERRVEAREKRHKDQVSVTVFGIILYSIVLIGVVVGSYIGFKSLIEKRQEKQAIIQEEQRQREEAERKAIEEEEKAAKEAEEAAKEQALLEEQQTEQEEESSGYKDLVFSAIENVSDPGNAPVNSFDFVRKSLDSSEKLMDYEVYKNPESGEIAKVTTRENCGDLFEITDYYFYEGKVNYIAQYREDTDVPVDLSGDKIESRFYFDEEEMVRYIYCESGKAVEYSVEDFDLYSDGTVEQYRYMEDMMLASSKTVFEKAEDLEETVVISGYVLDELNNSTNDEIKVELLDKNNRTVDETIVNGDGFYSFTVRANDTAEYHIFVSGRDDMISTEIFGITVPRGTKSVDVETVYLAYTSHETIYPVQIFVKDAEDANIPVTGATIKFRYGFNNKNGEVFLTGQLGEAGDIMPSLRSGNYTAEITKEGYELCYATFTVKADHTALVVHMVKDVPDGSYKCVLSYETTPLDLDIRAFDTFGRNVFKSTSDSVGATTAETITLNGLDSGTYTFYVSDYTDIASGDMMSYKLSQSLAKMYVYDDSGLKKIIPVPSGHAGVVWRPFEIRNHKIFTVDDYYAYIEDDSVFRSK